MNKQQLADTVQRLIDEGDGVRKSRRQGGSDECDPALFVKWLGSCLNLLRLLGNLGNPFREPFDWSVYDASVYRAKMMYSYLGSIRDELKHGTLVSIEQFVRAATFDSLLEQAEYVLSEGYFIPAGVLARAVLEEHLRNWCDAAHCTPVKPKSRKPTLNDYNDALRAANKYNPSVQKHVLAMSGFGNDAAHYDPKVEPGLQESDVEWLLREVREFMVKHPVEA
ncbi:MAG: hypothetical protein WD648_11550 [Planctomycetaceae bacterium]